MDTAIFDKLHELCEFTIVDNPFVWDLFEGSLIGFHIRKTIVGTAFINTDKRISKATLNFVRCNTMSY
jgi:hypothetical protein